MVLNRAIRSAIKCNGCRQAVLKSFASIAELELQTSGVNARPLRIKPRGSAIPFSQLSSIKDSRASSSQAEESSKLPIASNDGQTKSTLSDDVDVPWYMKLQQQLLQQQSPLSERQKLPKLPENPPPILPDLLSYISVDLGLDDLNLMDLRSIDPPPALGSNLLMLVGSARSEKHLHVSADRFCRWLRSTYKLRPHAAGLLGRNELKLKLKRKAKRMRLMANVGVTELPELDDGIRTGWICVTVGKVPAAEGSSENSPQTRDIVGFNEEQDGVNIVVQMFTDEKRMDIDLEGLWEGILRRVKREASERAQEADEQDSYKDFEEQITSSESALERSNHSRILEQVHSSAVSSSKTLEQLRHYHNSSRGLQREARFSFVGSHGSMPLKGSKSLFHSSANSRRPESRQTYVGRPGAQNLKSKIAELHDMPNVDAKSALGSSFRDRRSTGFLRSFYCDFPDSLDHEHWEALMDLWDYAASIGHSGYPRSSILTLKEEMQASGVVLSEEMYSRILKAILAPISANGGGERVPACNAEKAMNLLEEMHGHGYNVTSKEILSLIHSMAYAVSQEIDTNDAVADTALLGTPTATSRLLWLLSVFRPTMGRDMTYQNLLISSAQSNDWQGFWDTWHFMPRTTYRRSALLYCTMLNCVAGTGDQTLCAHALRECVADFHREEPPVQFDSSFAESVLRCVAIVEPSILQSTESGEVDVEWIRLLKRCQAALRRSQGEAKSTEDIYENRQVTEQGKAISGLSYA